MRLADILVQSKTMLACFHSSKRANVEGFNYSVVSTFLPLFLVLEQPSLSFGLFLESSPEYFHVWTDTPLPPPYILFAKIGM